MLAIQSYMKCTPSFVKHTDIDSLVYRISSDPIKMLKTSYIYLQINISVIILLSTRGAKLKIYFPPVCKTHTWCFITHAVAVQRLEKPHAGWFFSSYSLPGWDDSGVIKLGQVSYRPFSLLQISRAGSWSPGWSSQGLVQVLDCSHYIVEGEIQREGRYSFPKQANDENCITLHYV